MKTVVGLYDDDSQAVAAVGELQAGGIDRDSINMIRSGAAGGLVGDLVSAGVPERRHARAVGDVRVRPAPHEEPHDLRVALAPSSSSSSPTRPLFV